MTNDHENAHRPLPVILRPVVDELLSSWLVRHAAYYGVTGSFFAKWLMLGTRNLSALDHRLGLAQVARLSEKLRCDPITLIAMTFVDAAGQSAELICRGRAPQICRACADRHCEKAPPARSRDIGGKPGVSLAPLAACPSQTRTSAPTPTRPCSTPAPSGAYGRKPWPARRSSSASFAAIAPLSRRPLRSCARCWCRHGGPAARTAATRPWAGRSARSFPSSTSSRGPSNEGSTTRQLQPCPSLFGPRFWRASRARWPIPPFSTPSGMTRYLGDEGRLNVYGKRPGSTLMQREKPSNVRISPSRYSQVKWLSCREVPYSQAKRV